MSEGLATAEARLVVTGLVTMRSYQPSDQEVRHDF